MVILVAVVSTITLRELYSVAFDEERTRLVDSVRIQARLIEAIAQHEREEHPGEESIIFAIILDQIEKGYGQVSGSSETGEFTLAKREGDRIRFLLRQKHHDQVSPLEIPLDSDVAEPMRRALTGNSGTIVGFDYRGQRVLAAHEPLDVFDLGVVAKVDMAEIRKPFVEAGLLVFLIGVILISIAALLFLRIGFPVVRLQEEHEKKFRTLFEHAPDAIVLIDSETGALLDFNKRTEELLGYSRDELKKLDLTALDVFEPDREETIKVRKIFELGTGLFETRMRTKEGGVKDILVHARKIVLGKKTTISSVWCDITFQKKREQALRESQEKYQNLLDNAGLGITLLGPDMEVLETNKKMRSWFEGVDLDNRPSCFAVYKDPPRKEPCTHCPAVKTFRDGLVHESSTETSWEGGTRNFRITSSPIHGSDGQIIAALEIVEEITERLKLEAQLRQSQKLEALGTLAGGIAHDFNNILYAIMGNTELAIENLPEAGSAGRMLGEVLAGATRASNLVKQILAFSRQTRPERKVLPLAPLLHESGSLLRATLPSTIEFELIDASRSAAILGDPSQVQQVLMNLFSNAVHAMGEVGGELTVRLSDVDIGPEGGLSHLNLNPGPYLLIAVGDTGSGIAEDKLERVFEPFFTTKDPGEGTGLGLAVVHGIVKSLEGGITVESEPGVGSTFNVYFPKADPSAEPVEEMSEILPEGRGRILFVDDEETIVTLGQATLESLGYEVVARQSSVGAWAEFQDDPDRFDLVVTDQTMPEMTGTELAEAISRVRPDKPIILCLGYGTMIPSERIVAAGISQVLSKPISRRDMALCVRNVLTEVSTAEV